MTKSGGDAVGRLGWGLRRHAGLVVALLGLIVVVAAASTRPGPKRYRATVLVVAKKLELRPEQFPRFGEAVFATGAVAQDTADHDGLDLTPEQLIPGRVSMQPIQDTIAYRVNAVDRSATNAAGLANAAAAAFVSQLNKAGDGVGVFYVQDFARVPTKPIPPTRTMPTAVVMGLVAGAALSLGIVSLLLIVRDPVTSAEDAAATIGAPVVSVLKMPSFPATRVPAPRDVGGLAVTVRRLFPLEEKTCVLMSCEGAERPRSKVALLLAGVAAQADEVCVITSTDRPTERLYRRWAGRSRVRWNPVELPDDAVVIIDGPSLGGDYDTPDMSAMFGTQVLVVQEGVPRRVLDQAGEQILPGDLKGLLFVVKRRRRLRRRRPPALPSWPRPAADAAPGRGQEASGTARRGGATAIEWAMRAQTVTRRRLPLDPGG